jgi:multidrug efflux pump subunit AcrB
VVVVVSQPGADAADLEEAVARPIEDVLQGLDDIDRVRSRSADGISVVTAEFSWSSDAEADYDEVVREVTAIRGTLPSGIRAIEFRKVRTTESALVQLALVSETASFRRLEKLAEDLRDRLNSVPGVRESEISGLERPQVRVGLDTGRLAELGIPAESVADAVRSAGADLPVGAVHAGERRLNVEAGGAFRSLEAIGAVPVRANGGAVVRIRDIASVAWAEPERDHITRLNGQRAIFVSATQKDGSNALDTRAALEEVIADTRGALPPDVSLQVGFDQTVDIRSKLAHLARDFAIALTLVLLTLLPLGWRASLVVMVSIPLSLGIGMIALGAAGFTLNQLAIAGFILALGLVVDDSIVVVENISRHIREGQERIAAAIWGTKQIAAAVLGTTGVLIFSFLPLLFLPEGAGRFTQSLPFAVVASVAGSLLVALTITPFLASRFLRGDEGPEGNRLLQAINRGIHRIYAPLLHRALDRPRRALVAALALCFAAFGLVPVIGFSLFPAADTPYFLIDVEATEGGSVASTDQIVRQVSDIVAREQGVIARLENAGRGNPQVFYNVPRREAETDFGQILVVLDRWDVEAGPAMLERLRRETSGIAGAQIVISPFENGAPVEAPVAFRISGPDLGAIRSLAGQVEDALRATPGARDVTNPLALDRTDLDIGFDEAKAAALDVPPGAGRRALRLALEGESAARIRDEEGDSFDVVVGLPNADAQPVAALQAVYVPTRSGDAVPLRQIASPQPRSVPARIDRYELQRTATVTAEVQPGALTAEVTADAEQRIAAIRLPAGYAIQVGGEAEARARSTGGLGPIILLAVFGILAVLLLEFGTFRQVLIVLGVIPLGTFGGLIALALTGNSLSYMAIIGFIALIGIEIKNSVLLVDFTTQLRREGCDLRNAIEKAGEIRFLPVLLTSVTAIGGLLPLALGGTALYAPLAWVIIGGLVSSTLLSRVVTPVMYLLIERRSIDSLRVTELGARHARP